VSERLSFEQACEELGVSAPELEALVAAGEITATKDGDALYFSRDAIDMYRKGSTEPSILLTDDEVNLLEDEEIDFGIDLEEPLGVEANPKTEKLSTEEIEDVDFSTEDLSDDPGETIAGLLEDEDDRVDETALLEDDLSLGDDDTLLDTDILSLGGDDSDTDTFDLDTADETLLDVEEEGTLLRSGGARVMQLKRKKSGTGMTVVLAITALVLLLPMSVLVSLAYLHGPAATVVRQGESHQWIQSSGGFLKSTVIQIAGMFK